MTRSLWLALTVVSASAFAQVSINGNIIVVQDPTGQLNGVLGMNNMSIFPSKQEQFCRAAYNTMRAAGIPDEFDGVISFTASEEITDLDNVWQGSPVRSDGSGYGRTNSPSVNSYSGAKISQCVFMGTLGRTASLFGPPGPEALPANPDDDWAPSLGFQIPGVKSLTGIEMMGHEYGHHWLLGAEFDQNDSRGRQHFIRGFNGGDPNSGSMGYPNQHYSHNADSRSVMYGECITDLGNGSFRFAGCARKYSHIDQYLMGLRGANEVTPMLVLEDPASPGQGVDTIAMSRTSSPMTVNGLTRHEVSADEIVRAMGARIPAYPTARNCWRVAFVVVLAPGQTSMSQAMIDKVKRYEARWPQWFNFATDGRGTMDTRITGMGCVVPPSDGGVVVPPVDAGVIEMDGGVVETDAGIDAGEPMDAGTPGEELDAGDVTPVPDAGNPPSKEDTFVPLGTIRPGCGCGADAGASVIIAAALVLLRRRRTAR